MYGSFLTNAFPHTFLAPRVRDTGNVFLPAVLAILDADYPSNLAGYLPEPGSGTPIFLKGFVGIDFLSAFLFISAFISKWVSIHFLSGITM